MSKTSCNRRDFLKTVGTTTLSMGTVSLLSTLGLNGCAPEVKRLTNVILIITDDQGWGDVHSHGNDLIDTPVLDRLADSGARFDRFYVSPVCAPTRASILTGRYHPRTGTHGVTRGQETMRMDEVTLADIFKQSGYFTGYFGKWHNGAHYPYHPNGRGFDEFFGFCAGHWNNYFDTALAHNSTAVKTTGYIGDVLTEKAITFIDRNQKRPFLCYLAYNQPHSPFQVPDRYFNKFKDKGLADELACVYGMCENLDDNIGRILDKLKELKLDNDTIVIFLTDNGPNTERFNGDMRGRKGSVHEGGIRVPCFLSWPGHIEPGTTIKEIAAHIDILPTLVELTGVPMPETKPFDGTSLVPLLTKKAGDWPERMLFSHWQNRGTVRTHQYRLVLEKKPIELYDMINDPSEQTNIAAGHPEITAKLKSAYDNWLADVTKDGFEPLPIPIGYEEWPEVELPGHEGFLEPADGTGIRYQGNHGWANDWIANWTDTNAHVYWELDVVARGIYEITLRYACSPADIGAKIQVEIGGTGLEGAITTAHAPAPVPSPDRIKRKEVYEKVWDSLRLGQVQLDQGRTRLVVRPLTKPGRTVMELKGVRINRVR